LQETVSSPPSELASPRRPGRPRRAEAAGEIIDATLELLAERGFQATTMDAIAERAGVGKNTIYRRWEAKDDLILDALRDFTSEIELQPGEGDDVYAILLDHLRHLATLYDDPRASRILPGLLSELQHNPGFAEAHAERVIKPLREPVLTLLTRARERGQLRADADPQLIADMLVGPGFFRMVFADALPRAKQRYPEELLGAIWHGIATPAASS
jgi:AcrR family transcriptional regulator